MYTANHRQQILDRLDQLPPLHQVAQKLIALMNDDRSSAQDLDKLIRNDQALTARVLKLANSSIYGKSRSIFQVTEAVVLLGHSTLTNLVLGASVADVVATATESAFTAQAWEHSLDCAAIAQALAEISGSVSPGNAFVAGLMHDIGLLVQAQAVPEVLAQVMAADPVDPMTAEREAMGLNHAQIGLKLLDKWCLPPDLCEAVRFHHSPKRKYQRTNPLINIVALADQMTLIVGNTPYPHQQSADLFQQLSQMGISAEHFGQLFKTLTRSRDNVACLLQDADLGQTSANTRPSMEENRGTIGLYAADSTRLAWYAAVLEFLDLPLATDPQGPPPTCVLVDFHGTSPAERFDVDSAARQSGVAPIVVGECRHTPGSEFWQQAPHLPELFTRAQFRQCMAAVTDVVSDLPVA